MSEKTNFILYKDYQEHVDMLTDDEAGKLFKAIFKYVNGRVEVELKGATKMAFSFIKTQLERDLDKYKNIVDRNRENGKKGGRPTKKSITQDNPKNPVGLLDNPKKPKKADNDNDNVYDNDNDNDNVKETINSVIADYTSDVDLQIAIKEFSKNRTQLKKRMTVRSMKLLLGKLDKLYNSKEEKLQGIDEAILNGWASVFPLKEMPKKKEVHIEPVLERTKSLDEIMESWDEL